MCNTVCIKGYEDEISKKLLGTDTVVVNQKSL